MKFFFKVNLAWLKSTSTSTNSQYRSFGEKKDFTRYSTGAGKLFLRIALLNKVNDNNRIVKNKITPIKIVFITHHL
jgi:hypothetical protein